MPFELSLSPDEVRVAAGESAELAATIRNAGDAEEEYALEVQGLDPSVFRVPEATLRLAPGAAGQLHIFLSPPAAANLRAATYTFRVRVSARSREHQTAAARLTIEPALALNLDLAAAGADRFDVNLRNDSNTEMEVQLQVEEPERSAATRGYDYDLESALVRLRPGESARVPLRVRPRRRPLLGRAARHPFRVTATPQLRSARSESSSAYARCSPLLPWWLLVLLLIALLGLAVVALTHPHPLHAGRAPQPLPRPRTVLASHASPPAPRRAPEGLLLR